MKMSILFLDFDGVLRRKSSPLYKLESDLVNNLEGVLRLAPDVKIVITSSWREVFGLSDLRRHFSADIAERIEGLTPLSRDLTPHYRYKEILAYLKRFHTLQTAWIALDDDPEHFPLDAPVLIVDPERGLDADEAMKLEVRLFSLASKS